MSELQVIQTTLENAARRQRWHHGWRGLWQGLLLGSALWFLALVAYKIFPLPDVTLMVAPIAVTVVTLGGFVIGWWRKPALADVARWLDDREQLRERLSTALEFAGKPIDSSWQQLLLHDAAQAAQKLDPRRLLPLKLPLISRWVALVLALTVALGFVPEYRNTAYVQKKRDAENIRETGKQLADLTRRQLAQRPPALEPVKQSLDAVTELGQHLAQQALTKSDALKDLTSVTEKLKTEAKQLGQNPALKRLEQAARQSGGNGTSPGELQKQMDSLQKSLGEKATKSDPLDKLKEKLAKAQEQAAGMPSKGSPAGDAAREQLAQALSDLARESKDMGQSLAGLEEAIAALAADKTELMLKDLQAAMNDLDKLRDMAKALQQLQQQATRLGKDLAEQLKNGQAEAAQETLQKMIEQLKSANLSPEQMKTLLEEVSKAVDPAKEYGKVGELLKKGAGQMQQGDKPGAAQSLADAAKELKNLLDQLGDAQSLQATLEALQRAQLAIATGQSMGACRNPGMGKGGKPGRGVGTWAEEEGWLTKPEFTERWDNSGMVRPDVDPRGLTDRGDPNLPDNLAATKLRGQMSPGGSMPSITLKGVSIKGTSNVKFQEAAAAAQADAQSALNQDQVPRAYQNAVKDYFDDLKK